MIKYFFRYYRGRFQNHARLDTFVLKNAPAMRACGIVSLQLEHMAGNIFIESFSPIAHVARLGPFGFLRRIVHIGFDGEYG